MLKEMLQRFREKRGAFKEAQMQDRVHTLIEQRKKNANERELEGYLEEQRQRQIKHQLDYWRARKKAEERNMNILHGKNIFKGHKSVLTNNDRLFNMRANNLGGSIFFHE